MHQIIHELYNNDYTINPDILREILALPREEAIADLEMVIADVIENDNYYQGLIDPQGDAETELSEIEYDVLLHALLLLAELKAVESLKTVLNVLSQNEDFIEFWLMDAITDCVWLVVFKTVGESEELLFGFLKNRDAYIYAKTDVSLACTQLAVHFPEKREKIMSLYRDLLEFYLQQDFNEEDPDWEFVSYMVSDLVDIRAVELKDMVDKFYEKEYLYEGIVEDYDRAMEMLDDNNPDKHILSDIFEIYEDYQKIPTFETFGGDDDAIYEDSNVEDAEYEDIDEEDSHDYNSDYSSEEENEKQAEYIEEVTLGSKAASFVKSGTKPIQAEKTIGRNAPCPCGSGKKYKCCGK